MSFLWDRNPLLPHRTHPSCTESSSFLWLKGFSFSFSAVDHPCKRDLRTAAKSGTRLVHRLIVWGVTGVACMARSKNISSANCCGVSVGGCWEGKSAEGVSIGVLLSQLVHNGIIICTQRECSPLDACRGELWNQSSCTVQML